MPEPIEPQDPTLVIENEQPLEEALVFFQEQAARIAPNPIINETTLVQRYRERIVNLGEPEPAWVRKSHLNKNDYLFNPVVEERIKLYLADHIDDLIVAAVGGRLYWLSQVTEPRECDTRCISDACRAAFRLSRTGCKKMLSFLTGHNVAVRDCDIDAGRFNAVLDPDKRCTVEDTRVYYCYTCNYSIDDLTLRICNSDEDIRANRTYCLTCSGSNNIVCESCEMFSKRATSLTVIINHINYYFCKSCVEDKISYRCGHYHFNEYSTNGFCSKCANKVIREYSYKPKPKFFRSNSESGYSTPSHYFGIELEVEMRSGCTNGKDVVASRFYKDVENFAYLKKDSSISCGFEIVTHPASFKFWHEEAEDFFFKYLRKLTKTCESFSRKTTGLHIHVSRSAFDGNWHLAKWIKFMYQNYMMVSYISERYNEGQSAFFEDVESRLWEVFFRRYTYDRHSAINLYTSDRTASLSEQNTVEVRTFKGNMKKSSILKAIELLQAGIQFTNSESVNTGYVPKNMINFSKADLKAMSPLLSLGNFREYCMSNGETFPNLVEALTKYKGSY